MPASWPGYRLLSVAGRPTVSFLIGCPVALPAVPDALGAALPPPLLQASSSPASETIAAAPAPRRSRSRRLSGMFIEVPPRGVATPDAHAASVVDADAQIIDFLRVRCKGT